MAWYNGYSDAERNAKGAAGKRGRADGSLETYSGPCMLCGDPNARVEPHSEDYSEPYRWGTPAVYWLCLHCHRSKLHGRFRSPDLWRAFKDHVRRGGYASDLKDPEIRKEFDAYRRNVGRSGSTRLTRRRKRDLRGQRWWDRLRMDKASLRDPNARRAGDRAINSAKRK
jgi:hypothetical protein